MDIYEYLSSKSIIISDERFKGNVEVSISEQIQLISDAHKRLLAGKEAIIPRIQSVIGKEFEAYKVDIKKNKNYISKITNNKGTSYIEDYLIDEGTSIIKNAEETLSLLDLEIYFSIIKRRKRNYNINNIINEFANKSALDDDSVKYLRILSIYPNESMKVLNKCRNGKVDITNEDIVNKLKNAKECDDIKLL